jgi:phosphatidylserine/phosphatidylglycerophosphate/cardiolipin synthase-like enzyme
MDATERHAIQHAHGGAYPLRPGNSVVPLIDGGPAFARICDAVESARRRVWVTVAFLDRRCEMPGGRGTFFDVLDRAARRGVDVRVLFWDEPNVGDMVSESHTFPAVEDSHRFLSERESRVRVRWDRVKEHCHHQKSWVVDAGEPEETAFVGGINIDVPSMVERGHASGTRYLHYEGVHDVYAEIRGPASTDVAHNFIQRWNEASERAAPLGAYPSLAAADDLPFPRQTAKPAGPTPVQISRSILPGLDSASAAAPGADPFAIADGECSIGEQYIAAVQAARDAIYIENQILLCPMLYASLSEALERGVEIVAVVPRRAMPEIVKYRDHPQLRPVLADLAALGRFENFTMAALAAPRAGGEYADVYVHSKVAIVDDEWATIGSAHAMFRSWRGDTEMNASLWDARVARSLREDLFAEHLGEAYRDGDARAALAHFASVARANATRRARGEPLRGLVHAIDPGSWVS